MNKISKNKPTIIIIVTLAILIVASIAVFFISSNKTTITKDNTVDNSFLTLSCETTKPSAKMIFDTSNSKNELHKIKAIFTKNKTLDSIFYEYNGEYSDEGAASAASSSLHSDYNIFMGEHNQNQNLFTSTFSHIDNRAKFSLYANGKDLNPENLAIFLLNSSAKSLTIDSIKAAYETENFTCVVE